MRERSGDRGGGGDALPDTGTESVTGSRDFGSGATPSSTHAADSSATGTAPAAAPAAGAAAAAAATDAAAQFKAHALQKSQRLRLGGLRAALAARRPANLKTPEDGRTAALQQPQVPDHVVPDSHGKGITAKAAQKSALVWLSMCLCASVFTVVFVSVVRTVESVANWVKTAKNKLKLKHRVSKQASTPALGHGADDDDGGVDGVDGTPPSVPSTSTSFFTSTSNRSLPFAASRRRSGDVTAEDDGDDGGPSKLPGDTQVRFADPRSPSVSKGGSVRDEDDDGDDDDDNDDDNDDDEDAGSDNGSDSGGSTVRRRAVTVANRLSPVPEHRAPGRINDVAAARAGGTTPGSPSSTKGMGSRRRSGEPGTLLDKLHRSNWSSKGQLAAGSGVASPGHVLSPPQNEVASSMSELRQAVDAQRADLTQLMSAIDDAKESVARAEARVQEKVAKMESTLPGEWQKQADDWCVCAQRNFRARCPAHAGSFRPTGLLPTN